MVDCLRCCLLFGVRMARMVLVYVDIYLYTDGVVRDCGAFSCSCGGAGVGWWFACV